MKSVLRFLAPIVCAATVLFFPSLSSAFYTYENETGSFTGRGAVDISSSFAGNNGPDTLYPDSAEGLGQLDLRLLIGGTVGKILKFDLNIYQTASASTDLNSFFQLRSNGDYRTTYLEHTWGSGNVTSSFVTDQLSMMVIFDQVDMTIGRQPIGLASNFIFTPNDIFHPFSVGAADKTFRPGVDAFRIDGRAGQLAKITAIGVMGYAPDNSPSWEESAALIKGSMNAAGFDWSVLGGKAANRYMAGVAISGEVKGVGLRCEGNVSMPEDDPSMAYVQFSAGTDYKWANSLQLIFEYYYHGNGTMDPSRYLSRLLTQDVGTDQFLGIHYIGVALSGQPVPPLTLQLTSLVNVTDPSAYFVPAIIYQASNEIDLYVYGGIPVGRTATNQTPPVAKSEYGLYPYSITALVRVFF